MNALTLAVGLSWLYSISCGVFKDPEENLSIEAVDNASIIDSYATNALLNDEEVKVPDATVEIAPEMEATVSYDAEAESPVRAAADPTISVSLEPERSLDDIYEVLTQLVQLVIYQISEEFNKPEPAMPDYYYYPTPSVYMRSSSPFSRVRANKRKNSRKVRPRARPTPPPVYGRQVPYNQDLAGILNSIPPVYDDVSVHYNSPDGRPRFPNKRQRRDTIDEDGTINDVPEEEEEATIDIVDGIPEVNTPVDDADNEAEIIARQVAQEYAVWYDRTYLPWYNAMMGELEERRSYTPWFLNEGDDDDEDD